MRLLHLIAVIAVTAVPSAITLQCCNKGSCVNVDLQHCLKEFYKVANYVEGRTDQLGVVPLTDQSGFLAQCRVYIELNQCALNLMRENCPELLEKDFDASQIDSIYMTPCITYRAVLGKSMPCLDKEATRIQNCSNQTTQALSQHNPTDYTTFGKLICEQQKAQKNCTDQILHRCGGIGLANAYYAVIPSPSFVRCEESEDPIPGRATHSTSSTTQCCNNGNCTNVELERCLNEFFTVATNYKSVTDQSPANLVPLTNRTGYLTQCGAYAELNRCALNSIRVNCPDVLEKNFDAHNINDLYDGPCVEDRSVFESALQCLENWATQLENCSNLPAPPENREGPTQIEDQICAKHKVQKKCAEPFIQKCGGKDLVQAYFNIVLYSPFVPFYECKLRTRMHEHTIATQPSSSQFQRFPVNVIEQHTIFQHERNVDSAEKCAAICARHPFCHSALYQDKSCGLSFKKIQNCKLQVADNVATAGDVAALGCFACS